MPGKKFEKIKSVELVHASAAELVKTHDGKIELAKDPVDFSITENSPVVSIEKKLTAGEIFRIKTAGKDTPYLILHSWFHKVSARDGGVVFPKIFIFDEKNKPQKVVLAQIGHDRSCGLAQCLKFSYRIAELVTGTYKVVVTAQVDDIDVPLKEQKSTTVAYAPGVGLLPIPVQYDIFADFHGSFTAKFGKELPMDTKRPDVRTFTE